jgi:hypothetical protein
MNRICRCVIAAALASLTMAARADWPSGVWRSVGYGELVDITDARWRHFEVSARR